MSLNICICPLLLSATLNISTAAGHTVVVVVVSACIMGFNM